MTVAERDSAGGVALRPTSQRSFRQRGESFACYSFLFVFLLFAACREQSTKAPADTVARSSIGTRVTDLLNKGDAAAPKVIVEEFDGDFRPTWVTPLARSFGAEFELADDSCELVFGYRVTGRGPTEGKRVFVRVSRVVGENEVIVFEEEAVTGERSLSPWRDRSAIIPTRGETGTGSTRLVFRAERVNGGPVDNMLVGWSMPHVVCPSLPVTPRASPVTPHVVFVSIDTLRADHLSLYGYRRSTSPFLDRFASRAIVFDRAFSTAPWTAPSHASMFTGLYPEQHLAGHPDPLAPLPSDIETIATILGRNGYRTLGFASGGVMAPESGLGQGFDRFDSLPRTRLRSFLPAIQEEIERPGDEPLFLFVHTYDVHGPYIQPRGMRTFQADDLDPRVDDAEWMRIRRPGLHDYLRLDRFNGLEDVIAAYDSGIRYVDRELESLFGQLRVMGILENALVIVTSDHGEALYDRELYLGHTYTLHDELLRVPLIVRRVGEKTGQRRGELTDSTDLLPMILEELGLEVPAGLPGRNPIRALRHGEVRRSFVRGEAAHTGATFIRSDEHKVVTGIRPFDDPHNQVPGALRDRIARGTQWFDLERDPAEHVNNFAPDSLLPANDLPWVQLTDALRDAIEGGEGRTAESPRELSPAQQEELRSLGYAD